MSLYKLPITESSAHFFLINRSELVERLDPFFYKGFHAIRNKLTSKGFIPLGNFIASWNRGDGPRDGFYTDDAKHGIYFLRINNLKENSIDLTDVKFINRNIHEGKLKRAKVKAGDVVFAISGTKDNLGTVSVIPNHIKEANLNSALVRFDLRSELDKHFFCLLFDLGFIRAQVNFIGKGAAQNNLNNKEINSILVPNLSLLEQHRLVALFQAAKTKQKQKEQQAQELLTGIDVYLLAELEITLPQKNTRHSPSFLVRLSEVESRLDPHQFHHERVNTIKAIRKNNQVTRLHQLVISAKKITTEINEKDIYIGLENIASNTGKYIATSEKQSISSAILFKKGNILFPKLRPYLNKVHLAEFDGICSTEFHVFESLEFNSEFLAILLRSVLVVNQTKHLMTGNTLPRLQTEDIKNLIIPVVPIQKQNQIVQHVNNIRTQAQQLQTEAAQILADAKAEVERMILGDSGGEPCPPAG